MARKETKRAYMLIIWEILKDGTDKNKQFTINQIKDKFEEKMDENGGVHVDRKTIEANVSDLIDLGYPIKKSKRYETCIKNEKVVTRKCCKTYYYDNCDGLSDDELFILADSIFSSRFVEGDQADRIADWIFSHGSKSFRDAYSSEHSVDYGRHAQMGELLLVISAFDEAERNNKQLRFDYNEFNLNGKLVPVKQNVFVNAYYTAISNGYYYLVCNVVGETGFKHFRMDKITYPKVLDKKERTPIENIDRQFNISEYINTNINSSKDADIGNVILRISPKFISILHDNYEGAVSIVDKTNKEKIVIRLKVNYSKAYSWALQYGDLVEVVSPDSIRSDLHSFGEKLIEIYR